MSSSYKVLAPYVTTKVKDVSGQDVMLGYYQNGLIENPVDQKHVAALIELGMLEEADAPTEPEEPTGPVLERPAGNASQDAWATYAVESRQATEEEVEGLTRDELRELYG